ncbi:MAG: response regulator transcription factor [Deltaproteobacteria bacterium]|nr:response regulator transcription factor [Deltaproteobacteria bacterium]
MRILLVEDEARLVRQIVRGLREEGHVVDSCDTAADAESQALALAYDVVVLDWMLPDGDGLAVLRRLRDRGLATPTLMLTARADTAEKVQALRTGADDYLTKPFAFDELLARLEALHRRAGATAVRMTVADAHLDPLRRSLVCGDKAVALTAREFALARELFAHAGEVLTRSELLAAVWGPQFDGEPNIADVYIGYLRKKLAETGAERAVIRTVRGAGYRLDGSGP